MKFPKENSIDKWLGKHGAPEVERVMERNLAIANKVQGILKERGIKQGGICRNAGQETFRSFEMA